MKSPSNCFALAVLATVALDAAPGMAQSFFLNSTPITINDSTNPPAKASPYPSALNVSGLSGLIESVSVTLSNVNHTFPDDIAVLLVGPQGQSAVLMSDAGGGAGITNVTLTFSDSAANVLGDNGAIAAGTFKPSVYGSHVWPAPAPAGPHATNLSAFYAGAPNGVWNLFVMDDAARDAGAIANGWRLTITTALNLPPILDNVSITPALAENGIATLSANISDPNTNNSFALSVNWGDAVTNQNLSLPAGATNVFLTHRYLDDGQKGSFSEDYRVGVTLTDNGGVSADSFLSALIQDLLCRPFDPAQRSFYHNQIALLGRSAVAYGLLTGLEYRGKKTQDYYQRFLHHVASQGDQNFIALSALTEREIVSFILAGTEYFQSRGGSDNSGWLDAIFYDLLKRPPSAMEKNFYLTLIVQNGRGPAGDALLASQEFRQLQVDAWFWKFLHRASGVSAGPLVTALASQTWEQVVSQIIGSAEYYNTRGGGTDFAARTLTVTNVPPILSGVSIASPILEGGIASLAGQFTDPGSRDTFTLSVDWGDGSPIQSVALATSVSGFNVAHLFSVPDTTNLVHLTLSDDDGGAASQPVMVVVKERPPRIASIQRQPGSITRLDCLGVPARTYSVHASSSLVSPTNWVSLGQVTAAANGTFTKFDMSPGGLSNRFYRLRSP